ncbi:hypothetical protein DAT39_016960, partial [Clarias magur]
QVSSVKVSYSCLTPGVMKVSCSADGDNLRFNWASDLNTLPQLENGNSTLILDKDHHGNITCYVENHVSRDHITTELHPCPVSSFSPSQYNNNAHARDQDVEYAEVVSSSNQEEAKEERGQ